MKPNQQSIDSSKSNKMTWLAKKIFSAFPQDCTSLRFYILDCDCVYYQRVFRDGEFDPQIGIYRDSDNGPCDVCMLHEETWKDRVIEVMVVYNTQLQIEET